MANLFSVLKNDAVEFDWLVVGRPVRRESNVGDGRALLAQLDAENVHVFALDVQQLGQFVAELVEFTLDVLLGLGLRSIQNMVNKDSVARYERRVTLLLHSKPLKIYVLQISFTAVQLT